ncbi:MAG: DUF5329 family protein [Gammaproteobacteria bacterium]
MLPSPGVNAQPSLTADERAAIDYLLEHVEQSHDVFIRNGKDHDGIAAARHMRRKFEHYLDKDEVHSAEDFIRLAGTGSLISGRAYRMRLSDGREIETATWLTDVLAAYRSEHDRQLAAEGSP